MTCNFTTGHPRSWYVVTWKDSEHEVWPDEFCEAGTLRKVSLCALLSTLNLKDILCLLQQQLSYWFRYWILSKQEQLLHQLIIWQVLIMIMPHVYNTNRTHKPYKGFNDYCHFYIIILYFIILLFFFICYTLVLYLHFILLLFVGLMLFLCVVPKNTQKQNKHKN